MLSKSAFTVSAEVIPPRNGAEQAKVLGQIRCLIGAGAEFLAVTKGAGGSLRGGSLPIAQAIKEQFGVPCIAHFTCRDLTPHEIENQLMDHHYFGIRNILALRGDPPDGSPEWKAREGAYDYAYRLIEQIRRLNQGIYLPRPSGPDPGHQERTEFCIGAAAYPEHPDEKERLEFFKLKVQAGAEYGITQMIYDHEAYGRFLDLCDKHQVRVPILPGTCLLKSRPHAERLAARFRVHVPREYLQALPDDDGPGSIERAIEVFQGYVNRLRSVGAPGLHLFVLFDTAACAQALKQLAGSKKQVKQ